MGLFDIFKRKTTIKPSVEIKPQKSEDELLQELTTAILKKSFLEKFGKDAKYEVLESENIFFKELVKQVVAAKLKAKHLHFEPMSGKNYSVCYGTYPIGGIKLKGRKTYMQVLKGMFGVKLYENLTLEEYMSHIPDWIRRIKYCLRP